jgi:hypothetical protein
MNNPDGGPAFPTANGGSVDDGMTLRDYFAAKAMQGLIQSPKNYTADDGASAVMWHWSDFAQGAYQMADAMLKERSK